MKVHVGCGKRFMPDWVHVDIEKHDHVDFVCDIRQLDRCFGKGNVEEIYACHVIEHVGRHDILPLFKELYDVLAPGGVLRMAVPDLGKAIELYNRGVPLWPTLYGQFWGGQKNAADYHTIGFDMKTLSEFLKRVGFCEVERYDWREFLPAGFDDYSKSYLPHMDFENGECLSLNVVARKPMNKVVAFCTGGLCNALASLFVGSLMSKRLGVPLWVYWMEGYIALDVALTDLFDVRDDVRLLNEVEYKELLANAGDSDDMMRFAGELPEFGLSPKYRANPRRHDIKVYGSFSKLLEDVQGKDVFLGVCELPICINKVGDILMECMDAMFERFVIKRQYWDMVGGFVREKGIGKIGVHVRGTDILSISRCSLNDIFTFIDKIKEGLVVKVFLCSDDERVEAHYKNDDRVVFYKDKTYVVKRDEGLGWYHDAGNVHVDNSGIVDYGGKKYKDYSSCNVVRTKDQVLGGWVDLLTLASMEKVCGFITSNMSTYYKLAQMLNVYFSMRGLVLPMTQL